MSAAIAVQASTIYYLGSSYGETYWLSCGSSAGNYFVICNAQGQCFPDSGHAQQEADDACR
jgi:hypothetical protein